MDALTVFMREFLKIFKFPAMHAPGKNYTVYGQTGKVASLVPGLISSFRVRKRLGTRLQKRVPIYIYPRTKCIRVPPWNFDGKI